MSDRSEIYAGPVKLCWAEGSCTRSYHWLKPQLSAASNTSRNCPSESTVTVWFNPAPLLMRVRLPATVLAETPTTTDWLAEPPPPMQIMVYVRDEVRLACTSLPDTALG